MRFRTALLITTILSVSLVAFARSPMDGSGPERPGAGEPTLDELRRATDRFRDVDAASGPNRHSQGCPRIADSSRAVRT
jgi:hypothetical protein